jgi:hypothetical protein
MGFPLERIIPCGLHMFMGITRKLLKLFVVDFDGEAEATTELVALFASLGIKLWTPKEKKRNKYTISSIIKKSTLNRTQYIQIVRNFDKFHALMKKHSKMTPDHVEKVNISSVRHEPNSQKGNFQKLTLFRFDESGTSTYL